MSTVPRTTRGSTPSLPVQPADVDPHRERHRLEHLPRQARRQAASRLHVAGLARRPVRRDHHQRSRDRGDRVRAPEEPARGRAELLRRQLQGLPFPPGLLSRPAGSSPGTAGPPGVCSRCPAPTTRATCTPTPSGAPTASTSSSPAPTRRTRIRQDRSSRRARQRSERDADPVRSLPHSLQRRDGAGSRRPSPALRTTA